MKTTVEAVDLSNRRGAIVHLLPQVYSLLQRNGYNPPHMIMWNQEMKKAVVDIDRRWVFVLQNARYIQGMMFYRLCKEDKQAVYIDVLYGNQGAVIELLLTKFHRSDALKSRTNFYISRNLKRESAEELLESVGLQDESVFDAAGYQSVGDLQSAILVLRARYLTQ
ncbi:MAG: hypothetical protein FWG65_12240 [Turicibacter sp.]|nr:hypothetical protein [Turicibacter sp.]